MIDKFERERVCGGFKDYFGITSQTALKFADPLMSKVAGKFSINIIQFDDWLHTQGYTEETHGSMKDYIRLTYGNDAVEFIVALM